MSVSIFWIIGVAVASYLLGGYMIYRAAKKANYEAYTNGVNMGVNHLAQALMVKGLVSYEELSEAFKKAPQEEGNNNDQGYHVGFLK